jgi:hypothetical protein
MAVLSGPKRGIYGCFFSKTENQLFEHFQSPRNILLRIPCKISALTDKWFLSYGRFKRPKKGYLWQFFGVKLKINFLSIFEGIFSTKSKNFFFRIPCKI